MKHEMSDDRIGKNRTRRHTQIAQTELEKKTPNNLAIRSTV